MRRDASMCNVGLQASVDTSAPICHKFSHCDIIIWNYTKTKQEKCILKSIHFKQYMKCTALTCPSWRWVGEQQHLLQTAVCPYPLKPQHPQRRLSPAGHRAPQRPREPEAQEIKKIKWIKIWHWNRQQKDLDLNRKHLDGGYTKQLQQLDTIFGLRRCYMGYKVFKNHFKRFKTPKQVY